MKLVVAVKKKKKKVKLIREELMEYLFATGICISFSEC